MSARRRSFAVVAVVSLLACGGNSTGPVAGMLKVNLTSPNSGFDGAAVVVLSMPTPPGSVAAGSGLTLWGGPVTTTSAKVVLTGTLSNGTILTLDVDDINQASQYSATLQQVAQSSAPYVVRSLLNYSLTVTK
jgi:hypothetical protein